jgi:hypothetical protein
MAEPCPSSAKLPVCCRFSRKPTFPVLSVSEVESLRAALSDFALDIDGVPVHKKNNSA